MSSHTMTVRELEPRVSLGSEQYGLSMSLVRDVGKLSVEDTIADFEAARQQLRGEYESTLFEGLKSDKEFGEDLEVTDFKTWGVNDGHVLSMDGKTAIVDLVENGFIKAFKEAEIDERMQNEAQRTSNDLSNAREVENMVNGFTGYNTRIVVTAFPKEAMERDGEEFWNGIGYIKGLNYVQVYHATSDNELLTGAVSFVASPEKIREVMARLEVQIPEEEVCDNFINYALTANMTSEDAQNVALSIRSEAENRSHANKANTVEVLASNQNIVDQAFDQMLVPVAESLATGVKNKKTASIVDAFMQNSSSFNAELRQNLLLLQNSDKFEVDGARTLYQLICYSVIEGIRKTLRRDDRGMVILDKNISRVPSAYPPVDYQMFMAGLAQKGASAGRSYGGCGSIMKMADDLINGIGPQDVFGGKDKTSNPDEDEFGSLVFECTEGHKNTRKRGKILTECQHKGCKGTVGC